jgi:hypothetical protein
MYEALNQTTSSQTKTCTAKLSGVEKEKTQHAVAVFVVIRAISMSFVIPLKCQDM